MAFPFLFDFKLDTAILGSSRFGIVRRDRTRVQDPLTAGNRAGSFVGLPVSNFPSALTRRALPVALPCWRFPV